MKTRGYKAGRQPGGALADPWQVVSSFVRCGWIVFYLCDVCILVCVDWKIRSEPEESIVLSDVEFETGSPLDKIARIPNVL